MARFTFSRVVKLPREQVFMYFKHSERAPEWFPERFKSMKIVNETGNVRTMECEEKWGRRQMKYVQRDVMTPPNRVEQEIVSGSGKGTKSMWTLEETPNGTNLQLDVETNGFEMWLGSTFFRGRLNHELQDFFNGLAGIIEEDRLNLRQGQGT